MFIFWIYSMKYYLSFWKKKLNNIDVLYSLLNIDNERLNILNFAFSDSISSIHHYKLNGFCIDILPRVYHNVKCFILEPVLMEHILLAADYQKDLVKNHQFFPTLKILLNESTLIAYNYSNVGLFRSRPFFGQKRYDRINGKLYSFLYTS